MIVVVIGQYNFVCVSGACKVNSTVQITVNIKCL